MRTRYPKAISGAVEDLTDRIAKAWDWLWNYKTTTDFSWRVGGEPWITATELESRVRAAMAEELLGKPYGAEGTSTYERVRVSTGGRTDLLGECRDWLLTKVRDGELTAHNFGRGHISGMRFRPVGVPLTANESKALATPREERARRCSIIHYEREAPAETGPCPKCNGTGADPDWKEGDDPHDRRCWRCRGTGKVTTRSKTNRLCEVGVAVGTRDALRSRKWFKDVTTDAARVTCKRCLKRLAAEGGPG